MSGILRCFIKPFACELLICLALSIYGCANDTASQQRVQSLKEYGIVIDAGHGGQDPGAVSAVNSAVESELNLAIAKELESVLTEKGIVCTLTRNDNNALADTKEGDMNKRRDIIQSSQAPVMVSIHMNSFPDDPNVWGPQVFYSDSKSSKELADILQSLLNAATGGKRKSAYLDLFILDNNPMPSVLIECGFLSNEAEAQKLTDSEYQALIAQTIADGIFDYCGYLNP